MFSINPIKRLARRKSAAVIPEDHHTVLQDKALDSTDEFHEQYFMILRHLTQEQFETVLNNYYNLILGVLESKYLENLEKRERLS